MLIYFKLWESFIKLINFIFQEAEVEMDEEELDLLKNMDRQMNEEEGIEDEDDQYFIGNKPEFK